MDSVLENSRMICVVYKTDKKKKQSYVLIIKTGLLETFGFEFTLSRRNTFHFIACQIESRMTFTNKMGGLYCSSVVASEIDVAFCWIVFTH